MNSRFSLLGPLVLTIAYGTPPPTVRQELLTQYNSFHEAFKNHDGAKLDSFYDSSFEATGTDGKAVTRKQIIADFTQQMNAVHDVRWTSTIQRLGVKGQVADALVHGQLEAQSPGQDGKLHHMVLNATSFDHWKRGASGWKIFRTEIKKL